MKQAHIYFSGRVQGVGFRYTAQCLASVLGLAGWVKNLPSGQVEMLAQGEEDKIRQLLYQLQEHFGSYIQDSQVHFQESQNQFKSFEITH